MVKYVLINVINDTYLILLQIKSKEDTQNKESNLSLNNRAAI